MYSCYHHLAKNIASTISHDVAVEVHKLSDSTKQCEYCDRVANYMVITVIDHIMTPFFEEKLIDVPTLVF